MGVCATLTQAGTLYTTFGSADSYNTGSGATLGLGTFSGNGGYSDAFDFVPVADGSVYTIRMAVQYLYQPPESIGPNQLNVWLMSDNSGAPGAILEPFLFSGPSGTTYQSIITLESISHPYLAAGARYWLGAGPVDLLNSWYGWQNNDQSIFGSYSQRIGNGSWGPAIPGALTPAFDISTPEPSSLILEVSGMVCILAMTLLRRCYRPRMRSGSTVP
jgi:hypothetical protein